CRSQRLHARRAKGSLGSRYWRTSDSRLPSESVGNSGPLGRANVVFCARGRSEGLVSCSKKAVAAAISDEPSAAIERIIAMQLSASASAQMCKRMEELLGRVPSRCGAGSQPHTEPPYQQQRQSHYICCGTMKSSTNVTGSPHREQCHEGHWCDLGRDRI